jgi:hypothetical protein
LDVEASLAGEVVCEILRCCGYGFREYRFRDLVLCTVRLIDVAVVIVVVLVDPTLRLLTEIRDVRIILYYRSGVVLIWFGVVPRLGGLRMVKHRPMRVLVVDGGGGG